MSGHSHFKTVAATKNANDAKRGKIFSKMARVITIVVKEGGKDPLINAKLKTAIDKARELNMPKDNIERAIKKGAGELVGEILEEISIEGFGPGGFAIIIDGITDNKNRTLNEVKGILGQYDGKMAGEGAVKWMFQRNGLIVLSAAGKSTEDLELLAIEVGAEDVRSKGEMLHILTKPEDLEKIKKSLEKKQLHIASSSLEWVPKEETAIGEKEQAKAQKLFEALDEQDDVQDIYSNLKEN